jgi:hypothetical protein
MVITAGQIERRVYPCYTFPVKLLMLSLVFMPWVAAQALRISME